MAGSTWAEKVTVVLRHIPEDEDFEDGFEAETMTGVPGNVTISGGDPDSKEAALEHLINGLVLLGFRGTLAVEDATEPGPVERYEIRLDLR